MYVQEGRRIEAEKNEKNKEGLRDRGACQLVGMGAFLE